MYLGVIALCVFLRTLPPPWSNRTATLYPYTTLFRSHHRRRRHRLVGRRRRRRLVGRWRWRWLDVERVQLLRNLLDVLVRQAGHEGIAERNVEQADNHQRQDRKSTRLNSSNYCASRMPSSACKNTTTTSQRKRVRRKHKGT